MNDNTITIGKAKLRVSINGYGDRSIRKAGNSVSWTRSDNCIGQRDDGSFIMAESWLVSGQYGDSAKAATEAIAREVAAELMAGYLAEQGSVWARKAEANAALAAELGL